MTDGQAIFLACISFWAGVNGAARFVKQNHSFGYLDVIAILSFLVFGTMSIVVAVTTVIEGFVHLK